ncbi:MAG: type II toxin-antitoxin system VapC family toxin [Acidobacteriota bacterium]|nr:type II toxin-antitoxin system VapC family toxin [Acidobacteriota bacterium]
MALYFLDTSALGKYYRPEPGSDFVSGLFADRHSKRVISHLSMAEMESVFAIKLRIREIDQETAAIARRRLESDVGRRNLLVASVRDEHFGVARKLLISHGEKGLRTLDALQLSVALGLRNAGYSAILVASDQKFCNVAQVEGFAVTNPDRPGVTI